MITSVNCKYMLKLLTAIAMMGASACSKMEFSPGGPVDEYNSTGISNPPLENATHDSFTFNESETQSKVDVLFIVDNSRSMYEEQVKLGNRLDAFINNLARLDWRIAVTTTDTSDGPFGVKGSLVNITGQGSEKFITKNTPNYRNAFLKTVVRKELLDCTNPNCPSNDERPLEAAIMAMGKSNSDNAGFFRKDADLAIVVLSDEDERSNGAGAVSTEVVLQTFRAIFGTRKTLSVYGIIIQPGDDVCLQEALLTNSAFFGYSVSTLAARTEGVTGSICANDYSGTLSSIGGRVVELVKSVNLSKRPRPDTIQVQVTPADPSLLWTLSHEQTIVFNKPPQKGSKVDVYYLPQ